MNNDIQEAEYPTTSPTPRVQPQEYSFYDALRFTLEGKSITRIEWGTKETYGFLSNGELMIKIQDKVYQWIISEGDMTATDWIII